MKAFLWRFSACFGLLVAACTGWALLTPINGAADEGAHVIYAVVVAERQIPVPTERGMWVEVPAFIVQQQKHKCWAYHPEVPATCFQIPPPATERIWERTGAANYPPLYYVLVGWPAKLPITGVTVFYLMRLASLVVCSAIAAAGLALLGVAFPRSPVGAVAGFALTPMSMHLFGSVNPSGLEVAGVILVTATILTASCRTGRLRHYALIGSGIGIGLLINSRPPSPIWAVLIVVGLLISVSRRTWAELIRETGLRYGVLIAALASVWWAVWTFSTAIPVNGQAQDKPPTAIGFAKYFSSNALAFADGIVGNVGWLDTPTPRLALVLFAAGLIVLALGQVGSGDLQRQLTLVVMTIGVFAAPMVIQWALFPRYGFIWQGRYAMPLCVAIILAATAFGGQLLTKKWVRLGLGLGAVALHAIVWLRAARRFWFGVGQAITWDGFPSVPLTGFIWGWIGLFVATVAVVWTAHNDVPDTVVA